MLTALLISFIFSRGGKKGMANKKDMSEKKDKNLYQVDPAKRSKFRQSNNYYNGFEWGYSRFQDSLRSSGDPDGILICDASANTCRKYAYSDSVTESENGKELTKNKRAYYSGIADGILSAYDDYQSSKSRPRNPCGDFPGTGQKSQ